MNLFGIDISLAKNNKGNGNGKYVKREECHKAQDALRCHIDKKMNWLRQDLTDTFNVRFDDLNKRFEDFKDFILKNGK